MTVGNSLGNILMRGHGNNLLIGAVGNHTLCGGAGDDNITGRVNSDQYLLQGNGVFSSTLSVDFITHSLKPE
mgnify:CR=1 FL=1